MSEKPISGVEHLGQPARSLATAVFQGDWALGQVRAFIVFPAIGAVLARASWMVVGPTEVETTASTA